MTEQDTPRPPLNAVKAAERAVAEGMADNRTASTIAWGALGDAYPLIRRHVIEGLLEDLSTEISHKADDLADEFDRDTAWALGEDLTELAAVRAWLAKQ